MMNRLLGFSLLAVALVGCQGRQVAKNDPPQNGTSVDQPETAPHSENQTPPTDSNTPAKPGEADPSGIKVPEMNLRDVEINTTDKTWADETAVDAVEIARKMDAALRGAKNALVDTKTTFDIAGVGKLDGKGKVKVRDASTFLVEYYLPETEGNINRVVSSKNARATLYKSKWKSGGPEPFGDPVNDPDVVTSFEDQFMERIFGTLTTGEDSWTPLVEAWSKGQAGYDLQVEKKSMKVNGNDRPFYRFIAQRKKDGEATVEVRVDGVRYFPVSIKVLRTDKNGEKSQIRWNAEWKFGGSFSDKEFPVPTTST